MARCASAKRTATVQDLVLLLLLITITCLFLVITITYYCYLFILSVAQYLKRYCLWLNKADWNVCIQPATDTKTADIQEKSLCKQQTARTAWASGMGRWVRFHAAGMP